MAKKTNWNVQFINDYESIRRFLRPISYGCFSLKDICHMLNIKPSRYHQLVRKCHEIFPEQGFLADEYRDKNRQKHRRMQIRGDRCYGSDNFLAKAYTIKSLSERELYLKLSLLRILNQKKGISLTFLDILSRLDDYPSFTFAEPDKISPNTIKTHLQRLNELGLVHADKIVLRKKQKPKICYKLARNYFGKLSSYELSELLFAIDFYKNISPLSVPGYYLATTLRNKYARAPKAQPIQYDNHDIRCILEDDLVFQLLQVIKHNQSGQEKLFIQFQYQKNTSDSWHHITTEPSAVITNDFIGNRQQVIDIRGNRYPLSNIRDFEIKPASEVTIPVKASKIKGLQPRPLTLKFHYQDVKEKRNLQRRIRNVLPSPRFQDETEHSFTCTISVLHDSLSLLPLLRTFLPQIEIPQQEASLRQRMTKRLSEALSNYGIN